MRPTVSVTLVLSMGCWRSAAGGMFWVCEVGGGYRWATVGGCCEGFEEKEPADVLDVARERVLAKVEEVMLVVDSR